MRYQPELLALAPWVAAFGITPDTRDDGAQPITNIREAFGAPSEGKHFPVCIAQGALGFGLPYADLNVGP